MLNDFYFDSSSEQDCKILALEFGTSDWKLGELMVELEKKTI